MNKTLLLPFKFILIFVISMAVLCLFIILQRWGINASPDINFRINLIYYLPGALKSSLFPSLSTAVILTVFDDPKNSGRFLSIIIIAVLSFIILFFGFKTISLIQESSAGYSYQPLQAGKLLSTEDGIIYTSSVSDNGYSGVITRKPGPLNLFQYYQSGYINPENIENIILDNSSFFKIEPRNPEYNTVFKSRGLLNQYFSDIEFVTESIYKTESTGNKDLIFISAAFSLFLAVCLLFLNITIWPMFNIMLILFIHRMGYYIFRLFTSELDFITDTFFGGNIPFNLPLMTILAITVLILIVGVLFRPYRKKRDN